MKLHLIAKKGRLCNSSDMTENSRSLRLSKKPSMYKILSIQMLLEYSGNVGFVSLAGKYRTGKSFLLNKLLGLKKTGVRINFKENNLPSFIPLT